LLRAESSVVCLCVLLACSGGPSERDKGSPARLGSRALQVDRRVLTQLQQQLALTPERARELATEDALLANELVRSEPMLARSIERVVLARTLARALLDETEQAGPPTDSEVQQLTLERWWELDRPRMVAVVHAVVLSETENLEAEALARRIAKAVAAATSAAEFERSAKSIQADHYSVKVETLPPVTPDGRALDPANPPPAGASEQHLASEFAAAAQALDHEGQLSPVVRSPFGYHVLWATRIVEPRQPSLRERREMLKPEVLQRRALAAQAQLLERQRQESHPEQARSALQAMAQLAVPP
jgi:hypothetical protein